jgi:Cu(I)/Ag(I) efflux system membrane fusion protein
MTKRLDIRITVGLMLIAFAFFLGTLRRSGDSEQSQEAGVHAEHGSEQDDSAAGVPAVTIWTCSMHPQIQLPKPGQCPICGMDLIPLTDDGFGDDSGAPTLTMSVAAMKLAEVQTMAVWREYPHMQLRLVGKVEYDETRQRQIAAWVGGRLDRLYVDYTGISIRKGDHLAWLYSPELVSAQEELLQSVQADRQLSGSNIQVLRGTAATTVAASREKLRLLGLSEDQIAEIERRGKVENHVTINSPIDGIVIAKRAIEGDYVKTGTPIYEIADLSRVWVKLDAYESDLQWLRYGQTVKFSTEAYPGRTLEGRIAFIDPVLDTRTRTTKIRVNVDNTGLLLKPGMFVRAVVEADVASGGRVMEADLAGKWIGPMHPEVVKDRSGPCDVCGMPLVRAEDLGYTVPKRDDLPPLVIPTSAPLITGKRAVVYVRVPDAKRPTFEGREVVLGPRAGDVYIVQSGLSEGERIVVNGAFKIDSAMQISAKPSMMSAEGEAAATGHDHGGRAMAARSGDVSANSRSPQQDHIPGVPDFEAPAAFRQQLGALSRGYLDLSKALASDQLESARSAAGVLPERLDAIDMALLKEQAHVHWMGLLPDLESSAKALAAAADMNGMRAALPGMTDRLSAAVRAFGVTQTPPLLRFHCPMARDGRGADWLQSGKTTANPYYGAAMLKCGDEVEMLSAEGAQK